MSYAIACLPVKREQSVKTGCRWLHAVKALFKGFLPAPVNAETLNIHKELCLYIITMPYPEVFYRKNPVGKKRTMKKWHSVLKEKKIMYYLVEKPLTEYLGEGFPNMEDFLSETLNSKAALLFKTEPLRGIKSETLTIAVSGAESRQLTEQLANCLKDFRIVNVIEEENRHNEFWEDFMNETGVPVCRTDDVNVLQRSDVWLCFKEIPESRPFRGIKIDIPEKRIIFTGKQEKYRIGYALSREMLHRLGRNLLGRFGYELLANFLMHAMVHGEGYSIASAEEMLGINVVCHCSEVRKNSG